MLTYERHILHAQVNSILGVVLLVVVGLWATLTIWYAATGDNLIIKAFAAAVEKETQLR